MAQNTMRLEAVVSGRVQGIGFRAFTEVEALVHGLKGYVRNLPDGTVEIIAEGDEKPLKKFLGSLENGNPLARVENIKSTWAKASGEFAHFSIKY